MGLVAPLIVVVLVVALALAWARHDRSIRLPLDAGAALVAVMALIFLPTPGEVWLPLLFAAVAALIASVSVDGLFTSTSPRRHLVWLALAAGAVALWLRLSDDRVSAIEPYTLPLAAALIVIAAFTERARRRVAGRVEAPSAVIAFAGVVVALVPSALSSGDDLWRGVLTGSAAVALLVAGAWWRASGRTPQVADLLAVAVAAAGATGLVTLVATRVLASTDRAVPADAVPIDAVFTDAMVVMAAAAFIAAGIGVVRRTAPWARELGRASVISGIVVLAVGEATLLGTDPAPFARALVVGLLLGALAVTSFALPRSAQPSAPFGPLPGFVALSGGALIAALAIALGVRPIEWATLPLAAAVLVAALVDRADGARGRKPLVWGGGLAVALAGSAFVAASGDQPARAIVVLAVSGILILGACAPLPARAEPLRLPTLVVAAPVAVVTAGLRSIDTVGTPAFDAWMLGAVLPLVLGGALQTRAGGASSERTAAALLLTGLSLGAGLSMVTLASSEGAWLRAVLTISVLAAVGAVADRAWPAFATGVVSRAALVLAAVVALTAVTGGGVEPVELVSVPLAVAFLIVGTRMLRLDTTLGSWRALSVGLVVLLVPSLLFDFVGGGELWRAIGLGVVALGVLLAGVKGRLQAPVLLGGGTLLVHGIAQLWPWVAAIYESVSGLWWLWLGIAGVLLIVVAATYERRMRELRAVALAIRALR